ncbi:hypothetical protein KAS08_04320 [Candidatus Pacearchaeota archaeon]|nr:hypothetical protein [Candidatus Pacearchaeota archaeon]
MGERVFVIALAMLVLICSTVSAANVGVSPANINFKDVLRGGYAERPIIVTIDAESPVDVTVSTRGEIASWLAFSEENFSVSKGAPMQLMVSTNPPRDTPNGIYSGFVTVKISELGEGVEGFATGLVIPTLDVYVTVQITDQESISCQATSFKVTSAEQGDDIIFSLDVLNTGNIRISPQITFDIWDQDSINLVKQVEFSDVEIIPTKRESLLIKIPSDGLEVGQYWVDMSAIDCYASQTLTFDILEVGALRAFGSLDRIIVAPWADIDEIVPIAASFKNAGEKPLDAKFVGKITFKNKIIQLIESEESLFVPINEQSNFQFYFTPRKAGKYVISGRVFYDNKRTYEQSTILNVKSKGVTIGSVTRTSAYFILILIIATLIFKIHKERKSYISKSRGFMR